MEVREIEIEGEGRKAKRLFFNGSQLEGVDNDFPPSVGEVRPGQGNVYFKPRDSNGKSIDPLTPDPIPVKPNPAFPERNVEEKVESNLPDTDGNSRKTTTTRERGRIVRRITTESDKKGKTVRERVQGVDDAVESETSYEYDDKGKPKRKVESGGPASDWERVTTYEQKDGKEIEISKEYEVTLDGDGSRERTLQSEKITETNPQGNVTGRTERQFQGGDEKNVLKERVFDENDRLSQVTRKTEDGRQVDTYNYDPATGELAGITRTTTDPRSGQGKVEQFDTEGNPPKRKRSQPAEK